MKGGKISSFLLVVVDCLRCFTFGTNTNKGRLCLPAGNTNSGGVNVIELFADKPCRRLIQCSVHSSTGADMQGGKRALVNLCPSNNV